MPLPPLRAPAKLNLFLHLLGRRADGYHLLESLVVFTDLADTLAIEPAETLSLSVIGEFADEAGALDDNLVLRAARALQAKLPERKGAKLTLTKNIPVGAGLGGGSADAAAALRGLAHMWDAHLSQRDLRYLAAGLGADVPMCLDSAPSIARDTGTQVTPLLVPLPPLWVVLVYPNITLLTKAVYGAVGNEFAPAPNWKEDFLSAGAFIHSLKPTRNDLQRPAIATNPVVAETLLALETVQPAAELVRMTGSGACCFALYANQADAESAAANLTRHYPEWWVKVTGLAPRH